ncbi:MAG: flagellar export protein FliJ [Candidatus Eisenbacteria bacterium]
MGYRFRLQKVMDVKKHAEDRKKEDLAAAIRVLDREEQRLGDLHEKGEECRREMIRPTEEALDMAREKMNWERFHGLMEEILRQRKTVDHSRSRVDRERDALVEAAKARKTLESLRDRGLLEYMRNWLKREQKESDEVGRDTFLRNSK